MVYDHNKLSEDMTGAVFVYADWCQHCESSMAPMRGLAARQSNVDFYFLDADEVKTEEFTEQYNISEIPFFGVLVDGYLLSGHSGIHKDADVTEFVESFGEYLETVFS